MPPLRFYEPQVLKIYRLNVIIYSYLWESFGDTPNMEEKEDDIGS